MRKIEILTSRKAVFNEIINNIVIIIITVLLILGELWWLSHLQNKYNCSTLWGSIEDYKLNFLETLIFVFCSAFNLTMALGVIFSLVPQVIWGWRLDLKRKTTIEENVLTQKKYLYDGSKEEISFVCHQMTKIKVSQDPCDVYLGTGSLTIIGVTKTNATTERFKLKIAQIENPQGLKNELIELFSPNSPVVVINVKEK